MMDATAAARLARAHTSLEGLSVGDAFGERFFTPTSSLLSMIGQRVLPEPPWFYTDDTQMALSLVAQLRRHGMIEQDALAKRFGRNYDPLRGYGPAMHQLLPLIRSGKQWRTAAASLFGGQGSFGNGGAMRVAPLGAYFADDLDAVKEQAARSAEVTHTHHEGIAGAIAVALAAAWACWLREEHGEISPADLLDRIAQDVPESQVRAGIVRARDFTVGTSIALVAGILGSGSCVTAQDTVPFALWCATQFMASYEEALWQTVSGLGDRDTTCAIVGGIVAGYVGSAGIPPEWRAAREPLPAWDE
jgi:ADP-ribosylglycohydrolase